MFVIRESRIKNNTLRFSWTNASKSFCLMILHAETTEGAGVVIGWRRLAERVGFGFAEPRL